MNMTNLIMLAKLAQTSISAARKELDAADKWLNEITSDPDYDVKSEGGLTVVTPKQQPGVKVNRPKKRTIEAWHTREGYGRVGCLGRAAYLNAAATFDPEKRERKLSQCRDEGWTDGPLLLNGEAENIHWLSEPMAEEWAVLAALGDLAAQSSWYSAAPYLIREAANTSIGTIRFYPSRSRDGSLYSQRAQANLLHRLMTGKWNGRQLSYQGAIHGEYDKLYLVCSYTLSGRLGGERVPNKWLVEAIGAALETWPQLTGVIWWVPRDDVLLVDVDNITRSSADRAGVEVAT